MSAAIAAFFGSQGQAYQAASTPAAAFHNEFVQTLSSGTGGGGGAGGLLFGRPGNPGP